MWWIAALAFAGPLVPVQGELTDAGGAPLNGPVVVTFELWDAASGGTVRHTEPMTVQATSGLFGASLGSVVAFSETFFRDHPSLWLDVVVGGVPSERVRVGTTPYAAWARYAGDAAALGGLPADRYVLDTEDLPWSRVTGAPVYTANGGLVLTGTAFSIAGPVAVAQGGTGVTTAAQNLVFASPSGAAGAPAFRALVAGDLPNIDWTTIQNRPTTLAGYGITDGLGAGGTGALTIPVGTTAQRPSSPTNGMIRINSTTGRVEYYLNGWNSLGSMAASGGTIVESGGFRIHTFTTSGTLTVTSGGNAEVLVVGGGGGGAGGNISNDGNGGGGGGGVIYQASFGIVPGTFAVTVGAGGTGGAVASAAVGGDGGNSSFSTLVAVGGGGGGSDSGSQNGRAGGSGGGAGTSGSGGVGGTGTSGQGNAGGLANAPGGGGPGGGGGGGGGAGGVGGNGSQNLPGGNGGPGLQYSISGSAVWYGAGGGGSSWTGAGGTGGSSCGGRGGSRLSAYGGLAGTPNTGCGGGAGTSSFASGNGGSGIVIIRYPI